MIDQKEFYGGKGSYSYLVTALGARAALLIDPTPDLMDDYVVELEKLGRECTYTLETGSVPGARWAAREIARYWAGRCIVPCDFVEDDRLLRVGHGDVVNLGGIELGVIGRLGRTNAAISYQIADRVFVGDRRVHEEPELLALGPDQRVYRSRCPHGENAELLGRSHHVLGSHGPKWGVFGNDIEGKNSGAVQAV